jgi:hypothetical protein
MFNPLVLILAGVGEQAAKEKAEASAAKAKQDLEQAETAQKAAEQTPPVLAVTPPSRSPLRRGL